MFRSLCILGRQPAIGVAELESLYGSKALRPVSSQAVLINVDPCLLAFDRLGGAIKFCKVLTELDTTDWKKIEAFLVQASPEHAQRMPAGKMRLGLSGYGLDVSSKRLELTAMHVKSAIKKTGRNVRVVPNNDLSLDSAQVLHNQLTGPTGWELVFVRDGHKTIIAQTVKVQDITSYAQRDRGRPKRDAKVGMLPPKLAQIIINLAVGELPEEAKQSVCEIPPEKPIPLTHLKDITVLDPFCGTGVILQEAILMGYCVAGTDLDQRMIDYAKTNLDWLHTSYQLTANSYQLESGDATNHTWSGFDTLASETYLGRPFTSPPSAQILEQTVQEVNTITKKFLQNIGGQTKPGFRLCLALPAWKTDSGFQHLPLLDAFDSPSARSASTLSDRAKGSRVERVDHLTDMGYNRVSFVHAAREDMIYHRPGQIVGRELVTLIRN